jgi:hypothetical protein
LDEGEWSASQAVRLTQGKDSSVTVAEGGLVTLETCFESMDTIIILIIIIIPWL